MGHNGWFDSFVVATAVAVVGEQVSPRPEKEWHIEQAPVEHPYFYPTMGHSMSGNGTLPPIAQLSPSPYPPEY